MKRGPIDRHEAGRRGGIAAAAKRRNQWAPRIVDLPRWVLVLLRRMLRSGA